MSPAVWILLLIIGPIILFIVWLVLLETSIRVEPGTLGLLLVRGRATGRAMTPGRHFIRPWRKGQIQTYPSRELALVAGGTHQSNADVDYIDLPVGVRLGDHAEAQMSYTMRCQLIPSKVQDIHDSFGPEGIWAALRDVTRRCVISDAAASDVTASEVFVGGYAALEQRITNSLRKALDDVGFELRMFNVRVLDLGETGDVMQSAVRAGAELELEQALAEVRRARVQNDADLVALIEGLDHDQLLRYRQLEAWRDATERWRGPGGAQFPGAITPQGAGSAWTAAPSQPSRLDSEGGGAE